MDTLHIYEQSQSMYLRESGEEAEYSTDYESFNEVVDELKAKGRRDIKSEGYDPDEIVYDLELDLRFGGQIHVARIQSPRIELTDESDVEAVCEHFIEQYKDRFSPYSVTPSHGITLENFALRARVESPNIQLPTTSIQQSDPSPARSGTRDVRWSGADGFVSTPVFEYEDLRAGMEITGPAVVDADYTTTAVPEGWEYRLDEYRNGILENGGNQ